MRGRKLFSLTAWTFYFAYLSMAFVLFDVRAFYWEPRDRFLVVFVTVAVVFGRVIADHLSDEE